MAFSIIQFITDLLVFNISNVYPIANFIIFASLVIVCMYICTELAYCVNMYIHKLYDDMSFQLYKNMVHGMVSEFIPLTMNTITLQPSLQAK